METSHTDNRNQYALITGATSGIGYEVAKLFARDGYNLILVARHQQRLQAVTDELKTLYAVEVTPLAKDLFEQDAAVDVYQHTKDMGITVNILVNDAGQGQWGPFLETDLQRDVDIIQLNIISLLTLTKLFLKDMVQRNEGKILQLGSEASTTPMPLLSVYAATKAFVLSFSAALANEVKDTGVTITVLLPGATDTDFFHKAQQEGTVGYQEQELANPEDVAKDGYEALMKGESKIISGAKTKMHVWMSDLMGTTASAAKSRKLNEPSEKAGKGIVHEASRAEREAIKTGTGKADGDMDKE
ncbi:SDR family oxidoreductase [Chitinophaga sp.]|uniref:SDR family NAD(P)-dependent oxidoreductase n=1 Tax=Chitinophaga sp. TaxID=1869181 RepID=UPI0031E11790